MTEAMQRLQLTNALYDVLDPETGVNLVDLGLIYDVSFSPEAGEAQVTMTFTTPACPAGDVMTEGVERRLLQVPGVEDVDVEVTFEPAWTPERITAETAARSWGCSAVHALYLVSVWLHVLAAVLWLGGMLFLVVAVVPVLRRMERGPAAALMHAVGVRFRAAGWVCFALLLLTGTFNLAMRGVRWGGPRPGAVLGLGAGPAAGREARVLRGGARAQRLARLLPGAPRHAGGAGGRLRRRGPAPAPAGQPASAGPTCCSRWCWWPAAWSSCAAGPGEPRAPQCSLPSTRGCRT